MKKVEPLKNEDEFTSIYRKHFKGEPTIKFEVLSSTTDYDILSAPYMEVLLPEQVKYKKKVLDFEPLSEFYNKIITKVPKLRKLVDKEPDQIAVLETVDDQAKTVYQSDYCKYGFEIKKALNFKRIKLADGWELPQTVSQKSFRNFRKMIDYDLSVEFGKPPKDNLAPKEKCLQIRKVVTGETEYQNKIGTLGGQIVEEEFHGKTKRYVLELDTHNNNETE